MLQVVEILFRRLGAYCYKRSLQRALALYLRGEVRRDGLNLTAATTHLEIEWQARDIHPWDRELLSPSQKARAFVEQALADTEAAIYRLFSALPQVNLITLRVREQESERLIISGTVLRRDTLAREQELSIGMRLRYLGVTYHSAGALFEPLEEASRSAPLVTSNGAPGFQAEPSLANAMYRDARATERRIR
jgi:hypothetical protein